MRNITAFNLEGETEFNHQELAQRARDRFPKAALGLKDIFVIIERRGSPGSSVISASYRNRGLEISRCLLGESDAYSLHQLLSIDGIPRFILATIPQSESLEIFKNLEQPNYNLTLVGYAQPTLVQQFRVANAPDGTCPYPAHNFF